MASVRQFKMCIRDSNLIAENGTVLAERRFADGLTVSEVDVARIAFERRRITTFPPARQERMDWSEFSLEPVETSLTRPIGTNPFVPDDSGDRDRRCREILHIAALGLKKRLAHTAVSYPHLLPQRIFGAAEQGVLEKQVATGIAGQT